jgi:hypothetical protein
VPISLGAVHNELVQAGKRCKAYVEGIEPMNIVKTGIAAVVLALAAGTTAQAQSVADFYKGKNVDLMIGYSVGGGYDVYARLIARHMGKHIPGNPTVTPKNMEGAGSLRLANWLYNVAPKDGLVFGTIGRGTGFDPLLGHKQAQFVQLDRQRQRRGQRLRVVEQAGQRHQI